MSNQPNQVKDTFRGIFDDVIKFAGESESIIENAKVYTERRVNTGSYYETRYYGKDKDLVEKYAADRLAAVDKMRSPSLSCFGKAQAMGKNPPIPADFDGYWYVDLKCYGLD